MTFISSVIDDVRAFIHKEKKYSILLILTILLFGVLLCVGDVEHTYQSPALEKMEKIEELQSTDQLNAYLEEQMANNTTLQISMGVFNLYMLGLFIVGVALNLNVFFRLREKRALIARGKSLPIVWDTTDVAKSIIILLAASLVVPLFAEVLLFLTSFEMSDNVYTIAQACVFDGIVLLVMWYFIVRVRKASFVDLGLTSESRRHDVFLGLVTYSWIVPIFFLMILIVTMVADVFQMKPPPHTLIDILVVEDNRNPALVICSIVLASVIGPVVEELFFRGFLYGALRKVWGIKWAIVVSSLLFAYVHHSAFAFVPICVLGAVLAYVRERRGSLIPSIVMHSIHNTTLLCYFFIIKRALIDSL